MKTLLSLLLVVTSSAAIKAQPISLHPDNPHYFLFQGKPTVLITSAEHYGLNNPIGDNETDVPGDR